MNVVVAGAGETGRHLAQMLSEGAHNVVLLDRSTASLQAAEEVLDVMTVRGDCTSRSVLRRAEVSRAAAYIAVTDSGTSNVLSAALARVEGARVSVARMDDPAFYATAGAVERGVLGIDHILSPPRLTAGELLRTIASVDAVAVERFAHDAAFVAVYELRESSPAAGRPPEGLDPGPGAVLAAVIRDGRVRPLVEVPRLEAEDRLVLAGCATAVAEARHRLVRPRDNPRVLVVGAGDTGALVARALSEQKVRVALIDSDADVCAAVAPGLPGVTVLHGDGTSPAFLADQQVDSVDAVVAVTGEDQVNLMVSLLAQQLGVPGTYIEVHRSGYAELYRQLGIAGAVATYDMMARAAVYALQNEHVRRVAPLLGSAHALVELTIPEGATTLGLLDLPPESVPVCVVRAGAVLPPRPTLDLMDGDALVLLHPQRLVGRLAAGGRR